MSTPPRFIINVTDPPLTLLGPEEKVGIPKPQALVLMRTCARASELFLWGIQQWLQPSSMGGRWSQSCPVAASSQGRAEGATSLRQVQRRQLDDLGAPWLVQPSWLEPTSMWTEHPCVCCLLWMGTDLVQDSGQRPEPLLRTPVSLALHGTRAQNPGEPSSHAWSAGQLQADATSTLRA